MKRIVLYLVAALATLAAAAAPVTPQRAAETAQRFWHGTLGQPTSAVLVDRSAELAIDGLYLFAAKERGFVVVSGDDVARPVLAYSTANAIDPACLPVQLAEWLEGLGRQIVLVREAGVQQEPQGATYKVLGSSAGPLLSTLWDQDAPYNNLCPEGTVTGCAATAQAMLMKYWNFPAFGQGSHSYVCTGYGLQQADFAHTVYDWDCMPDSASSADSEREQTAVATLMYHVGVSLDMRYNTPLHGGSAAAGLAGIPGYASMDNSLKDYFHYNPGMHVVTKGMGFTDESWRDTLMAELDLGHPILYTGSSTQGGHGFVCDGYDTLGMMHFNFGWSGIGNGYYAIGNITPGIGPTGSLGQYDFSSNNQALLGAVPVYGMYLSDSVKSFVREGGIDSLLLSLDPTQSDMTWSVASDAPWLMVQHDTFSHVGWVRIAATENTSGQQRVAHVTFGQAGHTVTMSVFQDHYSEADYCPMTVVMESRRGNGWLGDAHLTMESEGGQVFGTAKLAGGYVDSVVIPVSPLPLHAVWHSGGGTDRFVNYTVKDPAGRVLLQVENAYLDNGHHVLASPCSQVGINRVETENVAIFPNPAHDYVTVNANDTQIECIELIDMMGKVVCRCNYARDLSILGVAPGFYILRVVADKGTFVKSLEIR